MDVEIYHVPAFVGITKKPTIAVAKICEKAKLPTRKHPKDAGMDFYSLDDTIVCAHDYAIVSTGIRVLIQDGLFGLLKPKSSSFMMVGGGVVDCDYRGEIMFKIFNITDTDFLIESGNPIGQMVLIPVFTPEIELITKEEYDTYITERGATGGILNAK